LCRVIKSVSFNIRQAGNKVIVLTSAEDGKPSIEISPGIIFRFYLFCENVYFIHFTNWDQDNYNSIKFYATNQNNNFSETNRYLSIPLPGYDDKVTYHQGSLVVNAQKEVNESLQENPAGAKSKSLSDKNFWKQLTENKIQYCTTDNLIDFTQNLLPLVMLQGAKIKVETFDNSKEDFKKTLLDHIANNLRRNAEIIFKLTPRQI
jgi:hypothetical protein